MYSIAIDGPAGAGKTTTAKAVAKKLGFLYVDTGAMYRTIALAILRSNWDLESLTQEQLDSLNIEIKLDQGDQHMFLDGEDVTPLLRSEEVSMMASSSSALPMVRAKLLSMQRSLSETHNVVMEGRDIGTVVLPQATLKIFLTATADVRAYRRMLQLGEPASSLTAIFDSIKKRDKQDSTRKEAPLKKATDSIVIDNSDMSIEDVTNTVLLLYPFNKGN